MAGKIIPKENNWEKSISLSHGISSQYLHSGVEQAWVHLQQWNAPLITYAFERDMSGLAYTPTLVPDPI